MHDSDGIDISDDISVSILQEFNSLGYKILDYSVHDKERNTNNKKVLLRQYTECPLQATESRLKIKGENQVIEWTPHGEIDVTANQLEIIEENGVLTDQSIYHGTTRCSFNATLTNFESYELNGDKINISQTLSSNDETFVVGQFSENLNLGNSSVISDYKHNIFIASFNPVSDLNWVKTFGSES